ncbi:MAG: cell wall-active antibiotics response protein [Clostridiales bacterium]|nr:cell wall-active antibiotics response protein [Clostridiales bacterium]
MTKIIFGAVAVLLGLLMLLSAFDLFEFKNIYPYWTLFIIVPSVASMITNGFTLWKTALLALGVNALICQQHWGEWGLQQFIIANVAVCFILFGIYLLVGDLRKKKPRRYDNYNNIPNWQFYDYANTGARQSGDYATAAGQFYGGGNNGGAGSESANTENANNGGGNNENGGENVDGANVDGANIGGAGVGGTDYGSGYAGGNFSDSCDYTFYPKYTGILSSNKYKNCSKDFKGGSIVSVLGGVAVDLSEVAISGDVIVNATSVFGNVDIFVPNNIRIDVNGTEVLGSCDNFVVSTLGPEVPCLHIKYCAVFGNIDIKTG